MKKKLTLLCAVVVLSLLSRAQVSITNIAQVYTQDFNTLANTGSTSSTLPAGWSVINNIYTVGTGSANTGAIYSFGATSSSDRALGSLATGGLPVGLFGCKFVNNSGVTITKVNISYMGEMWRLGSTGSPLDSLYFEYTIANLDSVNQVPAVWTEVSSLAFITPDSIAPTGPRDGNSAPNRALVSGNFGGLNITNGTSFWIRWRDQNSVGSDDGMSVDSLTVTFENVSFPACTEPANSVSNVVMSATGSSSVNGSFTGVTADGYLVLVSTSNTQPTITDGVSYSVDQTVGSAKVVSAGSSTSFTASGLTPSTLYYCFVFPYNNVLCTGGPNYRLTNPGVDTATTTAPTISDCTQPSGVSTSSITKLDSTTTTIHIKWTNSANADSVIVFAAPTNTIGFVTLHDSVYYGVGATVPSSGSTQPIVYYRGIDSSVLLTGLVANTVYKIFVVSFNNKNCTNGPNYAGLANVTIRTAAGTDCQQPTGVSTSSIVKLDSTSTTIQIKWTNPALADSVMVFAGANNTIGFVTLHDSVYYGVGATIPSDGSTHPLVYYRGKDSSVTLTGLTPNMVYKIFVVSFNNVACTNGPNYGGLATTTIRTAVSTGIKMNKETAFSIYPNPVNDKRLNIRFSQALAGDAQLEIVDMVGRKVLNLDLRANIKDQLIDVSTLSKGMYYMNIWYKGDNSSVPFVIK